MPISKDQIKPGLTYRCGCGCRQIGIVTRVGGVVEVDFIHGNRKDKWESDQWGLSDFELIPFPYEWPDRLLASYTAAKLMGEI